MVHQRQLPKCTYQSLYQAHQKPAAVSGWEVLSTESIQIYKCLDRSDRDPFLFFDERNKDVELKSCKNVSFAKKYHWTNFGYMIDHHCISTSTWCNLAQAQFDLSMSKKLRSEIVSPVLCENFTLWRNKPCEDTNVESLRCFGHWSGQCIYLGKGLPRQ